jgi:hypothetical protein
MKTTSTMISQMTMLSLVNSWSNLNGVRMPYAKIFLLQWSTLDREANLEWTPPAKLTTTTERRLLCRVMADPSSKIQDPQSSNLLPHMDVHNPRNQHPSTSLSHCRRSANQSFHSILPQRFGRKRIILRT